jgi:hypothetical protein
MAATVQLSSQPYCGLCQGKAQTQPLTCQRSASFRSCAGIRAGQLSRFKAGSRNKPHQVTAESLLQSSSRCIRSHAHATACRARAHGSSASHGGVDSEETDVIIVGAGLAGLSAAHMLQKASESLRYCLIVSSQDHACLALEYNSHIRYAYRWR